MRIRRIDSSLLHHVVTGENADADRGCECAVEKQAATALRGRRATGAEGSGRASAPRSERDTRIGEPSWDCPLGRLGGRSSTRVSRVFGALLPARPLRECTRIATADRRQVRRRAQSVYAGRAILAGHAQPFGQTAFFYEAASRRRIASSKSGSSPLAASSSM